MTTSIGLPIGLPIGVLGGTFDPVHNGHVSAAEDVAKQLRISDMRLMPNYIPPHRGQPLLAAAARLEALQKVVAKRRGLSLEMSEWQAAEQGDVKAGYSVESLKRLRAQNPASPLVFVLGVDAYANIHLWKNYQELLKLCHLVVVTRPNSSLPTRGVAADWLQRYGADNAQVVHDKLAGTLQLCPVSAVDVSATQIRELMANGQTIAGLVPAEILSILEQKNDA